MLIAELERWDLLSALFDELVEQPPPQRRRRIAEISAASPALGSRLEALFCSHQSACDEDFLGQPIAASLAMPTDGLAGTTLGRHTLLRPLGEGGSGSVWLAQDNGDRRHEDDTRPAADPVALKLLHLALFSRAGAERLSHEGDILARLDDPRIARLLGSGRAPWGQPYLVLEWVRGEPIDAYCRRHRLTVTQRLELFTEVVGAIAHAHRLGIVHGDIKPANALVTEAGGIKLLDFGVATLTGPPATRQEAAQPGRGLTLEYAAPEQLRGEPVTPACDVYALGVMLHHLLGGGHPTAPTRFDEPRFIRCTLARAPRPLDALLRPLPSHLSAPRRMRAEALQQQLAHERQAPVPALRALLNGPVSRLVARMLSKAPQARPADGLELARDLSVGLAADPPQASPYERPKAGASRPSPTGIKESGGATFP